MALSLYGRYHRTAALDLVVDRRSEEGRIKVLLAERFQEVGYRPMRSFERSRGRPGEPFGPASHRHRRATSGRAQRSPPGTIAGHGGLFIVTEALQQTADMPLQSQSRSSSPQSPATSKQFFKVRGAIFKTRFKISLLQTSTPKRKVGSFGDKMGKEREFQLSAGASQCGGSGAMPLTIGDFSAPKPGRESLVGRNWRRERN